MANKFSRKSSVFILALTEGLERFSYYGMRGILILYLIDSGGLSFSKEYSLSVYGKFTILIGILPFFMGLLTDIVLKQEKGIITGALVSLVGYFLLCVQDIYFAGFGLILIAFGSTLVRGNIPVLVGRLFEKRAEKRVVAFIGLYLGVNVGAFFSAIVVGTIGEAIGWSYGFAITGVATFLYLLLFVLTKDRIAYHEEDIIDSGLGGFDDNDDLLDYSGPSSNKNVFVVMLVVSLFMGLFWQCYAVVHSSMNDYLEGFNKIALLNIWSLEAMISMLVLLIVGAVWYYKEVGAVLLKLSFGMIALGIASISVFFILGISESNIMLYSLLPITLFAIAEAAVSPMAMSYITRLSPMKWTSTAYGFFIGMTFLIPEMTSYLGFTVFNSALGVYTILAFVAGVLLFVFRHKLMTWSGGID